MNTDFSRRSILKFAAALGSAATLPAVALAAPDRSTADPAQLSDNDLLNYHMAEVERLLCRMHPLSERVSHGVESRPDGTYKAFFHGTDRKWLPWTGAGLYRVSNDGQFEEYWIELHCHRGFSGNVILEDYHMTRWHEGEYIDREYPRYRLAEHLRIVEKLDGLAPC